MADARLAQHIERGNEDGLLISSVANSANLWAIIMDAGTGFTSQVYELSPHFLHKVWAITQPLCYELEDHFLICLPFLLFRIGSWINGRKTTTSALLLVPIMGTLLL